MGEPKRLAFWLNAFSAHQLMVLEGTYVERYAPDYVLRIPMEDAHRQGVECMVQFGKLDKTTRAVAEKVKVAGATVNVDR